MVKNMKLIEIQRHLNKKESLNDPNVFETVKMWGKLSDVVNAPKNPNIHVQNVPISTSDIAKIIQDAEIAIIKDENPRNSFWTFKYWDEYETDELSVKTSYKKPPLQGIDVLQNAAPKHNVRNARALPMLTANVTNFFRIQ